MGVLPATSPAVPPLLSAEGSGGRMYANKQQPQQHNLQPHVFLRSGGGTAPASPAQPTLAYFPSTGHFAGTPQPFNDSYLLGGGSGEGFRDPTFSELMRT